MKEQKSITLKTLTKSSVWDVQENDVFRMWESAERDADFKDNMRRYTDIIKSAFEVEDIKIDKPEIIKKYTVRGFKVGTIRGEDGEKRKMAIKKRPILRVTDLTYENVRHISAAKLVEVLGRNFGGGWDSLSQSVQDIILSGFDISTTALPHERLHNPGGLYEKKVNDGYDVLEIAKGTWTEAIFIKEKPEEEPAKPVLDDLGDDIERNMEEDEEEFDNSDEEEVEDDYKPDDEEEDDFDEEKLTAESYRTTYDEEPEDLSLEAEEISDEGEEY